LTRAGRI
jgi:hypothetical protein